VKTVLHRTTGGCFDIRRLLLLAGAAAVAALGTPALLVAEDAPGAGISVREERGVYTVRATFEVSQPAEIAFAVLTDYEAIPRFMPNISSSVVRERAGARAVVEQEAVSRLMMFSKRVHLVLDIEEGADTLTFADRCRRSFLRYEGAWRVSEQPGRTLISYELTAQPTFDVPEFVLRRVLKRDSAEMIERLKREIASRALLRS
jgi:ribosome-associated toxin RatA of RatAB toxin-antitoxin module